MGNSGSRSPGKAERYTIYTRTFKDNQTIAGWGYIISALAFILLNLAFGAIFSVENFANTFFIDKQVAWITYVAIGGGLLLFLLIFYAVYGYQEKDTIPWENKADMLTFFFVSVIVFVLVFLIQFFFVDEFGNDPDFSINTIALIEWKNVLTWVSIVGLLYGVVFGVMISARFIRYTVVVVEGEEGEEEFMLERGVPTSGKYINEGPERDGLRERPKIPAYL